MRYQFVKERADVHRVATLCRVIGVSKSGYYAWRHRPPSQRSEENKALTQKIATAFEQNRRCYGSPRIYTELRDDGILCSENRIARLMRKAGILVEPVRRFRATTDSDHALSVAQNYLGRQFGAEAANTKWAGDITYLWTKEGWLYLAVVLDLFSRRVVGWSLAPSLHKELVLDALEMAVAGRQPETGLLHHSDRGSQYASLAFQERLMQVGATCSMSGKGDCWDNAVVESFFSTLKREMVSRERFETRKEARLAVFEWIEVWYNRKRRHSSLGNLSPEAFEKQQEKRHETRKRENAIPA